MLQKELAKRLKARYDTKMDGNGWLEVSSDGIPLCRIKYNRESEKTAHQGRKGKRLHEPGSFFDDGISGVTMDRPGFANMIQQLEQGKAAAVFVKDLSRLGRNYIEVGRLTEEFFPNHDIRLVAVSDNIDTDEGENELAPIRNLFNESMPAFTRTIFSKK